MVKRFSAMDPQQRRRSTFDALKRVLIRESQRQPLLVVFEDLHWIDSETQAFLDSLDGKSADDAYSSARRLPARVQSWLGR